MSLVLDCLQVWFYKKIKLHVSCHASELVLGEKEEITGSI